MLTSRTRPAVSAVSAPATSGTIFSGVGETDSSLTVINRITTATGRAHAPGCHTTQNKIIPLASANPAMGPWGVSKLDYMNPRITASPRHELRVIGLVSTADFSHAKAQKLFLLCFSQLHVRQILQQQNANLLAEVYQGLETAIKSPITPLTAPTRRVHPQLGAAFNRRRGGGGRTQRFPAKMQSCGDAGLLGNSL